jgi:spore maturation protein CgeB
VTGRPLRLAVFGLSLSSSWGNGHATTFRALLGAFARRGHEIVFFERDQPWYAAHRDLAHPDFCDLVLYRDLAEIDPARVADADAVIVGSYVTDGVAVGAWVQATARGVTAFYDIDTPVTLAKLERGDLEYLSPELIPGYDLYLSFTGGPTLDLLMSRYRSPRACALYCCVEPDAYRPVEKPAVYDLGYLGTYSADRQPTLERLLLEPARRLPHMRFVVAGPLYPAEIEWPSNVARIDHVPPGAHPGFYGSCRFTLNVTRADMVRAGHSPSVRLFEAAACGTPIISDVWAGIDGILEPGRELILVQSTQDVLAVLSQVSADAARAMAEAARRRVLDEHTADHRARELEAYLSAAIATLRRSSEISVELRL